MFAGRFIIQSQLAALPVGGAVKWTWGPVGAYGFAVGLLLVVIAAFIHRAARQRAQARRLTLLLAVEGTGWMFSTGLMYLTGSATATYVFQVIGLVFVWALPAVYLLFIGTLPSPLARPLRSRVGRAVLLALAGGAPVMFLLQRRAMILAVVPGTYSPWDVDFGHGILLWLPAYLILSYLYGLVVGIDGFRRAPKGSEQRRQMRYFLAAFGTRDLIQIINFGIVAASVAGVDLITGPTMMLYSFIIVPVTVVLIWALLLTYAVLRAHLFDIDLKVKIALKGTTLTSFFVAAFFIVSQLVQNVTSQFLGYVGGAVAAGVLLFALHPLQRIADRMANAAMPRVVESADYIQSRKDAVFSAALEGALQDGVITDKETAILVRLQLELGIANSEARALEAKVRAALAVG